MAAVLFTTHLLERCPELLSLGEQLLQPPLQLIPRRRLLARKGKGRNKRRDKNHTIPHVSNAIQLITTQHKTSSSIQNNKPVADVAGSCGSSLRLRCAAQYQSLPSAHNSLTASASQSLSRQISGFPALFLVCRF
jgi:hypothetical protein